MIVCILASGSSGNCAVVGSASTRVLIDAGLSGKETVRRLAQAGVAPESLKAVCLTHEHGDHIAGLGVLHNRAGLPLFANGGTVEGIRQDPKLKALSWRVFTTGAPFEVGDLSLEPFSVSHDAYEPVGFIVTDGAIRVGLATDIGVCTHLVRERLRRCHALVLEANHDEQLLKDADRPWSLKQRIAGRQGHLSNQHAAELIAEVAGEDLRHVFLAHLSRDCNRPELALATVRKHLDRQGLGRVSVALTFPDKISEVWRSESGSGPAPPEPAARAEASTADGSGGASA